MKVYVVTAGEYSDYEIWGIFSTLEKARDFVAAMRTKNPRFDPCSIQEWEVDTILDRTGVSGWEVCLDTNTGNTIYAGHDEGQDNSTIASEQTRCHPDQVTGFSVHSLEHARKLAVEARQKWLREKAGVV